MPNNTVAIVSIMSKFDEKSAREAAKRADKVYEEALSDIGNVNFDEKIVTQFNNALNKIKKNLKGLNLSSYTNDILDSLFSDKDIKAKSADIQKFVNNIESLHKSLGGLGNNDALKSMKTQQLDSIINKQKKIEEYQIKINEKTEEYTNIANKASKTSRKVSTIDKNYGNQDYLKTLELLKNSLSTEKDFTAEQNQSIENLAKLLNLYQIMEKSEPQKGTIEAIRYSKDLLKVTEEIRTECDKIDSFSSKGASDFIKNNGLDSINKVSPYTVIDSKQKFINSSIANMEAQKAKMQSELTNYVSDAVKKNLEKITNDSATAIEKAEKKVGNLQDKIESLQAKSTKTGSDNSIIGGIVSDGTEQELKNINNELSQIGNQDTSDLELMDKALENIKDNFQDVIKYAVDAETAFNKINELYKKFNKNGGLEKSELIDIVSFNDRLNMLDQKGLSNDKYIINNEDMLDDLDFWADKYGKNIDRIQKMTIEQIEEAEKLKSIQNEAISNSNNSQTEQLAKQEEQIKQTVQAEEKLLDTQDKLSTNTKISVDAKQAIADINKIKESLNSIPEEKNIKITISDSDYTNTPLLSNELGEVVTAFRGVKDAWSGLINDKGIGFFTDKLKLAVDYADELSKDGKVYQANLSFHNPLEVDGKGARWDQIDFNGIKQKTDDIIQLAKQLGHDGVIFKNIRDGFTDTDEDISNVMVALNAAQIKNEQVIGTVKAGTGEMVDVASKINNATDTATNSTVESQNKIQEELKETQKIAEQVSEAISKVNTNNVSFTQENSELDTKISDVEKLNNSVKKLISNSGDYKVGEIVDWDDTKKLLSTVQELDNYDVLKSLGLSEGAIQEEEGKIKEFVQTIKYQYDEFVNAWNKQDDDDIFSWSDSIGSNLNELNSYIDSLISSYKQLSDISSVSVDKSNISSENLNSGNVDKVTNSLVEEQKAVGELDMVFRGLEGSLNGFMSNSGRLATFFTTSPLLARQYADSLGGVYQAMVALGKSLDINAEGRDWNVVEYLGDGSDEASRKIIELRKQIDNLYEQLNASGASGTGLDGLVEENRGDFSRMVQLYGDAGVEYNSYIEAVEKGNVIENQENQTVKQLMIQLYELEKAYRAISDAKDNVYGTHTTDEFAELAKSNGYDSVMFRNIKDSFDRTKNLTDVGVIFDESQIASVKNVSNIIDDLVQKIDGVKTQHGLNLPINIELPKEISRLSDGNFVNNLTGEIYDDVQKAIDSLKELDAQIESTSPIKDVFQGDDNSNTSFSSNLDEIEKEKSALLELRNTVSLIIEEIDKKTQAFHNEKSAVDLIIPEEIATIESLERELKIIIESIEQISKIPINIDFNLENLDENSANVISKLKDSLSGFNGSSLTNISSILEGFKISKANVENLQKLANAILTLKSNLNNVGNSGQQFLSDIKELVAQSDGLKDLVTVLKSSQKQIDNAKKTTNANVDSKNTKENTNAWKELTYSIQRYSEVSKRISSGKTLEGDIEEASRLENKISQLQKLNILSPTQVEKSEQMLTKLYDTLDDIEKKSKETTLESLNSSIDKYRNDYNSRSSKPFASNQSNEYKKLLANYETSIEKLEAYRDKISNNPLVSKEDLNKIDELTKKVKKNATAFNSLTASQKGSTPHSRGKTIEWANDLLEQNSKWSKKAKIEVQGWIDKLATADPSNVEEIRNRILEIVRAEREAGNAGKTWLDIFSTKKLHSFLGQAASMFSFYDLVNVGREGFETIKEYDNALTEMNKVSRESIETLKDFQKESFGLSDAIGTTASQIQNSTADFLRLGESFEQAKQSAQDANALFKVAEFDNIDEATEALVAMSQAYKELDKSQINDVLNYTGNNFSISTSELASALQRSAATLKVAGNDIYEATALVTAGNAVLQDAETVGSGKFMPKYIVICRYVYISESSYIG